MKFQTFNQLPLFTDDFFMRSLDDHRKKDAIVIFNPGDALILSPVLLRSKKSLEEHIAHINENNIKKAIVVGDDIRFLTQCPGLEYLWILPSVSATDFDYSPIYEMPNLKWLICETEYGVQKERTAYVDYSQLPGLEHLFVKGTRGQENVDTLENLKALCFDFGYPKTDSLQNTFSSNGLESLKISQSPLRTLNGLETAAGLKELELSYNKKLTDISALRCVSETLTHLEIEACGKIQDFSVLASLHNLEHLSLVGSNQIPDVSFLRNMPKLQGFKFLMNCLDGDMSPCLNIPWVNIQNRKHYNHKFKYGHH